ncbi:carbohydrate ABC transporter permease [Pseudooceanicola sp. CBS1P-1]|uniref:ABC transporter permease subunit n=1 Tax=Pseudooceanicola albus TaxID=2692189 RepID=A0A6L7G418_9RHOB|nr:MULTISPECIES: carbohydrate ABC transporter permease [Pseudooceanicola]MBT9385286.1 carbohydrate ABC transporter permease [Pseudooceanicola endophyticus]MXN18855.1 ABC transporter permease subunit [Pseudooceanicola albus]
MTTSPTARSRGSRPGTGLPVGRIGLWAFILLTVLFFLAPLYVMIVTSLKTMDEVRLSSIFALPMHPTFEAWRFAWSEACTGIECHGLQSGFWNSVRITVPSVAVSVLLGAISGYALSYWKPRGGEILFALLMVGAFIPYQLFIYPLAFAFAKTGLANTLLAVVMVHVFFGLPIVTLIFRNYYAGLPHELVKAAQIDGAGFWRIFRSIILPLSRPILVVAVILQTTGVWNDFLFGLIFGGTNNQPMTVQLNALVSAQFGEKPYNVHMAATILTALIPLAIYLASGRWFVRGIAAGAVKG